MSGLSYLERARKFYQSLWVDNGTHSEEYIINQIAKFIQDIEFNAMLLAWSVIFLAYAAGLASGVAVIFALLWFFHR